MGGVRQQEVTDSHPAGGRRDRKPRTAGIPESELLLGRRNNHFLLGQHDNLQALQWLPCLDTVQLFGFSAPVLSFIGSSQMHREIFS